MKALLLLLYDLIWLLVKSFTNPEEVQETIDNALDNIPVIGWLNGWIEQFKEDIKKSEDAFRKLGSHYWVRWFFLLSLKAVIMSLYRCGAIWLFFCILVVVVIIFCGSSNPSRSYNNIKFR